MTTNNDDLADLILRARRLVDPEGVQAELDDAEYRRYYPETNPKENNR